MIQVADAEVVQLKICYKCIAGVDRCLVTKPTLLVEFEHNCIGEEEVVWKMCSGPVDFLVRLNAFGKFLRCLKSASVYVC